MSCQHVHAGRNCAVRQNWPPVVTRLPEKSFGPCGYENSTLCAFCRPTASASWRRAGAFSSAALNIQNWLHMFPMAAGSLYVGAMPLPARILSHLDVPADGAMPGVRSSASRFAVMAMALAMFDAFEI